MKTVCRQSASWVSALAHNAGQAITSGISTRQPVGIQPNILVAEYPGRRRRRRELAGLLANTHRDDYLIVNLSGQTYDTAEFQGPVMDVVMSGGVPPLDVTLRLCVSMHKWLDVCPSRLLVVHGADGKHAGQAGSFGPAIVLLGCYLSWSGLASCPQDGFLMVCGKLGVLEETLWPSHMRYIKYFQLLQNGLLLNTQPIGRPAIVLSHIVLVDVGGDQRKPFIEIWEQDRLRFEAVLDADLEDSIVFADVACRGDVCIRIFPRDAEATPGPVQPESQICFHTAFVVDNFIRFPGHEIDVFDIWGPKRCSLDVFFKPMDGDQHVLDRDEQLSRAAEATVETAAMLGPRRSEAVDSELEELEEMDIADVLAPSSATRVVKTVFLPEDIDSFFDDL